MAKSRAVAAQILNQVLYQQQSLSKCFTGERFEQLSPKQRPFVKEICFGTLRWYPRIRAYANAVLQKPLKRKESLVDCLLLVGIYQLLYMKVAEHAAIGETVAAVKPLQKVWAKGLLNACLRQVQRGLEAGDDISLSQDEQVYSHPQWIIEKLKLSYPDYWQSILQANNQKPPFAIRVNLNKTSVEAYGNRLGSEWHPICHTESGLILEQISKVSDLPDFEQGYSSVQDGAAQMAATLLAPKPGDRVLDACAAPGGKTCHLLEHQPGISELIALEIDPKRIDRIQQNLDRLELQATIAVADCADINAWWDGKPFDRILLDVPCSATGIIRRHPDIKWLRQADDIGQLAELQFSILSKVWRTLKAGGHLLYATCSIMPDENEQVIQRFVESTDDVEILPIALSHKELTQYGWQLLPGENDTDGFYYCLMTKKA